MKKSFILLYKLICINMKTLILNALKAKYQGVSETILSRIAEKLAKTVTKEEDVAAAVEAVTFQQVIDGEADRRATEATQSAVANYEKKHGLKDGAKIDAGGAQQQSQQQSQQQGGAQQQGQKNEDETPAWAKVLIEDNKALRSEISAIKGEKTANNRQLELNKILANAPEKVKTRYEKDFARINKTFESDDDFNAWLEEIKPDIEEITTEFNTKGGVVTRPKGGQGGQGDSNATSELLKARIAEKEAASATPAIQGLPQQSK